jgi:hypothetical protein
MCWGSSELPGLHANALTIFVNPMILASSTPTLARDGFTWARSFVSAKSLADLRKAIESVSPDRRAGIRHLIQKCPAVGTFASSARVLDFLEPLTGARPFAVRSILFDKTVGANWSVAWHQDLTIAVRERREVAGFSAWSVKEGVVHAQPPADVLDRMVSLRLHLDDCDETNGALRVLPGSHLSGKLSDEAVEQWATSETAVTCRARAGDALWMRPLLLHASSPATAPQHRRVIHIEFASGDLPGGLEWAERAER